MTLPAMTSTEAQERKRNLHSFITLLLALMPVLLLLGPMAVGLGFAFTLLLASRKKEARKLRARDIVFLTALAFAFIFCAQLIKEWPDFKAGFLQGYRMS